jgi:hypothetical protein
VGRITPDRWFDVSDGCNRQEIRLSLEDDHDERARMRRPPAGPWGSAAPELPEPLPPRVGQAITTNRVRFSSIAFFVLMVLVVGARAQ